MNDDELRAMLRDEAPDGAPETLHVRVDRIPAAYPRPVRSGGRWSGSVWHGVSGLLAAAFTVAVLAGGAWFLLGGLPRQSGVVTPTSPTASAPPSIGPVPTSTAGAAVTPTTPTVTPTATRPPTPAPTAVAGPVPADFTPVSATFVSADVGWTLGSTRCGAASCAVIVRTTDGGRTWSRVAAPPALVVTAYFGAATSGVSGIRFANGADGWVFGPDLWATHDGGATWHRITFAGMAAARIWTLEAGHGSVRAVFDGGTVSGFQLASAVVHGDAWTVASVSIPYGAGPVPSVQLVLSGASGWVLEDDRVVVGGARLVGGIWQAWQPPCLDVNGPAVLAASTAMDVVAACQEGVWGPFDGSDTIATHLYTSTDGGTTFTRGTTTMPDVDTIVGLAAPTPSTVMAALLRVSAGSAILASTNGGHSWSATLQLGSDAPRYIGFTTASQGFVITGHALWFTYDGGHHWVTARFQAP